MHFSSTANVHPLFQEIAVAIWRNYVPLNHIRICDMKANIFSHHWQANRALRGWSTRMCLENWQKNLQTSLHSDSAAALLYFQSAIFWQNTLWLYLMGVVLLPTQTSHYLYVCLIPPLFICLTLIPPKRGNFSWPRDSMGTSRGSFPYERRQLSCSAPFRSRSTRSCNSSRSCSAGTVSMKQRLKKKSI